MGVLRMMLEFYEHYFSPFKIAVKLERSVVLFRKKNPLHKSAIYPVIPLLGIYPKECYTGHSRSTCAPMFTAVKLWEQPRCPTTDKWIKKMWYLYTMEFYSAMKKNEILPFASKWMELENIILSEVSQAQKTKNHMFSLICGL
jgi:hypothetical protein